MESREPDEELSDGELEDLPELEDGQYPPYVVTEEQRKRFRLCVGVASRMFESDEAAIWQAARSLYQSDIET